MSLSIIAADRLREIVRFEDLIEPVSRAFQDFSLGLATSELIVIFPAPKPELGDDGFEQLPRALERLFSGESRGKMLVRVAT